MGRIYYRPQYAVDYGTVTTVGSGNVLGDNSDGTFKRYHESSGSVLVYPVFNGALVPGGRQIIAVRAGHRQRNTGLLGLYNGWVCTYLRISGQRQTSTKVYKQDGYIDGGREIVGSPLYKRGLEPWTVDEISAMSTDSGAAVGTIGPNRNNYWCVASESFILVVYDEPIPVPSDPYPANGATISTSSVNFSARLPAPQMEQPVQAVFQVARDAAFTEDVRTFVGGLNQDESSTSRSYYVSQVLKDSYTNLGPGLWYMRMKGRDYRGPDFESSWSATTTFTISHPALPTPQLIAPAASSTVPTPYAVRSARFVPENAPQGDRRVGATWQFSKVSDFSSGVVQWTNNADGVWTVVVGSTTTLVPTDTVSYDPTPNASTINGLNGPTVGVDDPSQYLAQGVWYARVRATDAFGQNGPWSSAISFTVTHPPVPTNPIPAGGASFDQDLQYIRWTLTDPWADDAQTAYRLRVYTLADELLQDTGKVMSTLTRAKISVPTTHHRSVLKYRVQVWDGDDVSSTTDLQSTFRLSRAPQITLPYPAHDEQIISGQPALAWSCVFAAAEVTQSAYRVQFYLRETGALEFDSGTVVSTDTNYTPPRAVLKNLTAYQLALTITDSEGLSNTLLRDFSTNFERPAYVPSYADSSMYPDEGYVMVHWPAAEPDPFFFEWRIYRRPLGTAEWIYAGAVQDPEQVTFRDWLVAGDEMFEYSVTQAATRFGSIVESEWNPDPDAVAVQSSSYWFLVEGDEGANVELLHVVGDKFTDEREMNDYTIINGGRRRVFGTNLGIDGTLSAQVRSSARRTAKEQIAQLKRLNLESRPVVMRDPFGNLTTVALGDISVVRIEGVGNQEFADLEIPYTEVM